jgi:hypothetical protein
MKQRIKVKKREKFGNSFDKVNAYKFSDIYSMLAMHALINLYQYVG